MAQLSPPRSNSNSQTLKQSKVRQEGSSSTPQTSKRANEASFGRTCPTQLSTMSDIKKLKEGLSPPRARCKSSKSRSKTKFKSSVSSDYEEYDKTQWEASIYAIEAQADKQNKLAATAAIVNEASPLLGENQKTTLTRGEMLLRRPKTIIVLLCAELLISVVSIGTWVAADNPFLPQLITYLNLSLILVHVATLLVLEFSRVHMLFAHLLRALLLAANMTIMALDHDFDTGSIIVLAIQPIHLIIAGIHIIIALLPKIKH